MLLTNQWIYHVAFEQISNDVFEYFHKPDIKELRVIVTDIYLYHHNRIPDSGIIFVKIKILIIQKVWVSRIYQPQ